MLPFSEMIIEKVVFFFSPEYMAVKLRLLKI